MMTTLLLVYVFFIFADFFYFYFFLISESLSSAEASFILSYGLGNEERLKVNRRAWGESKESYFSCFFAFPPPSLRRSEFWSGKFVDAASFS